MEGEEVAALWHRRKAEVKNRPKDLRDALEGPQEEFFLCAVRQAAVSERDSGDLHEHDEQTHDSCEPCFLWPKGNDLLLQRRLEP